ncbi:unnamed protein product [Kluyveromyces dobzhanskii CBS 2104]|uniref:WGS project CCBQ000000000 data, contig 00099 n=1 Tax=Kluyveromyces dobzhanskii CBS 2104 TaxID=1427455 RepID=A0A0A8L234_9SACH|nr:unnamed protein product [Kluyveromyces dobzhanskii CBS 2104]
MAEHKRTEVTGKLSSRVMNMKFMQHAEQVEEEIQAIETTKRLVDSSEWRLDNQTELLTKLVNKPKVVQNIGFSAINTLNEVSHDTSETSNSSLRTTVNPGRRIFGSKPKLPIVSAGDSSNDKKRTLDNNDEDPISSMDLEKLWESETQNKKQKDSNGKSHSGKNKKKSKKSKH